MKIARPWESRLKPALASLLMVFSILGAEPGGRMVRVALQESDELNL